MTQADQELNETIAHVLAQAMLYNDPKITGLAIAHADPAKNSFRSSFRDGTRNEVHQVASQGIVELEPVLRSNDSARDILGFILALYYLAEAISLIPYGDDDISIKEEALHNINLALSITDLPPTMQHMALQIQQDLYNEI